MMLFEVCLKRIDESIERLLNQMKSITEARNGETKSSAGDKFETGRAMMQQEEDKAAIQLASANQLSLTLRSIEHSGDGSSVKVGSLVTTNIGIFYLAVGLGKVTLDGHTYFCVSPGSPVGQALHGLKVGAQTVLNGRELVVKNIA